MGEPRLKEREIERRRNRQHPERKKRRIWTERGS